jgi:molybdenum cofactor biosynthesis protein B
VPSSGVAVPLGAGAELTTLVVDSVAGGRDPGSGDGRVHAASASASHESAAPPDGLEGLEDLDGRGRWRAPAGSVTMRGMSERRFVPVNVAVLTVSDTRTLDNDTSGGAIVEALTSAGHVVARRAILPDDKDGLTKQFSEWIADADVDVVIATGGTGITGRDVTPDALAPLVGKWIPGFGELFRHLSFADIGTSTIQSRAEGAVCGTTLVFVLPGSTGAVKLALSKILLPQLDARTRPCNFVELMPRLSE